MIWQPEFTDKILSRKPGAVQDVTDGALTIQVLMAPVEEHVIVDSVLTSYLCHTGSGLQRLLH